MDDLKLRALLGQSAPMQALRALILKVARRPIPVLIQGPSGSGKELVAHAIHAQSERRGHFVPINICAVPETVFESVLFGHVRGAFTSATGDSPGLLAEAHHGTLFLDEISGLTLHAQPKLLRAVELGVYRPVGAQRDRESQFRVVAATNDRLSELVDRGLFRADLAYRLRGCLITVPALAERRDDIPLLAAHFLHANALAFGDPMALSSSALARLQEHDWPGNVRELKSVLARAAMLASGLTVDRSTICAALDCDADARIGMSKAVRDGEERSDLLAVLEAVAWQAEHAALKWGVSRATLYRDMKRLGITPPARGTGLRRRPRGAGDADLQREPDREGSRSIAR